MNERVILGVDPGTAVTGYGIIHVRPRGYELIHFGQIRLSAQKLLSQRYLEIHQEIRGLILSYHPLAVVTETQYMHKNVQSAIKLGMARGSVLLAAVLSEIEVFEYAPSQAKKAVTGKGAASKEQVKRMVATLLHIPVNLLSEDMADALALAICHGHLLQSNQHIGYRI